MMKLAYKRLYERNYAFYTARPRALCALKIANRVSTVLFFAAYAIALWRSAAVLRDGSTDYAVFMRLIGAPLLCLLLVSVLRLAIARPRPYSERGAHITPLLRKKGDEDKSFPSRHVACAFVLSLSIVPVIPMLGWALLPVACLLAYIRFALGLHYPTDLVGGAILGAACGILALPVF